MFDESTLFGPFAEIDRLDLPETHRSAPFEGLLGTFYTKIVTRATEDSAWFAEHVGEPRPTGVLDLCCGGGRSVLEFARKGWQVTGVDRSRTQLASARDLLAGAGPDVTSRVSLVREDVFSVDLGRAFDVVAIGGLSVTLFDGARRGSLLDSVRRHLSAGGRLVFDYAPLSAGERDREAVLAVPIRSADRSGFVLVGARREPGRQRQLTNMYAELVENDGKTRRWLTGFSFRLDQREELVAELTGHGFSLRHAERENRGELHDDPESPFGVREYVIAELAG